MTLIVGENGAGKSTMMDAICFALFGKAFRKINKPTLVNSVNGSKCVVELEYSTNGQDYKIIRGLKPAIFEIYVNGSLLNKDAATKDYQEILEKQILKTTFKSFTQIVILGSATFTPFMKLSAADRRLVIDDLLDIQVFSSMNVIAKQRYSELKNQFQTLTVQISSEKEKEKLLLKQIEDLKKSSNNQKKEIAQEIEQISNNLIQLEEKKLELLDNFNNLKSQLPHEQSVLDELSSLNSMNTKIRTKIDRLEKEKHFFEDNQICSTCHQPIEERFKNEIISKNTETLLELHNGLKFFIDRIQKTQLAIAKIADLKKSLSDVDVNIQFVIKDIELNNVLHDKKVSNLASLENNTEETILSKNLSYLHECRMKLTNLKENLLNLEEERENLDVALQLLKDGGIKSQIISKYLPVINSTVNKYLSNMDFLVNFVLDENFNETLKSRYRDEFSYENFSEGEKARIDLSLLLTWRLIAKMRNSVNTNLLILDEVFDGSLDSNGSDELVGILKDVVKGCNVFVISHKESMREQFDKTIKARKEKNYSILET